MIFEPTILPTGEKDVSITIERTPEFYTVARRLDVLINSLDLPADKHNELVALMIEQVATAERSAFFQGVELGLPPEDIQRMRAATSSGHNDLFQ